jgi:hypothetical protein
LIGTALFLRCHSMPTFPVSVKELLERTRHMNDTEKKQAGEDYLRQGRRFESGRETSLWGNSDMARRYFEASAELGNLDAVVTMGVYHSKGMGRLPIDENKALAAYTAAAKQGSARAKRNIATYYLRGRGDLCLDSEKAYKLLEQVIHPSTPPPALVVAPTFAARHFAQCASRGRSAPVRHKRVQGRARRRRAGGRESETG